MSLNILESRFQTFLGCKPSAHLNLTRMSSEKNVLIAASKMLNSAS